MPVRFANSDIDIMQCFPIMVQLRPHLSEAEFISRVQHQRQTGYHLVFLEEDDIKAIAGFRILDMLSHGRVLYVDDLVTNASERSKGYGSILLDWLVDYAQCQGCASLQLDSGTQRSGAHRFYFKHAMAITAFHFRLPLE